MATSKAKKGVEELGKKPVHTWPPGLQVGFKSLTAKTVKRAKEVGQVVSVCARHNLRENNGGHRHRSRIDPALAALNSVLEGETCPERVAQEASHVLARLGLVYPGRVDAVAAFEVVITPPDGWDNDVFWAAVMAWVNSRYEHVVSAVVHRDQSRPHLHVIALPVLGGRLGGREMQRGKWCVPALREDFLAHMLKALRLSPGVQESPLTPWALSSGAGPKRRDVMERRAGYLKTRAATSKTEGTLSGGHCANVPYGFEAMSSNAQSPAQRSTPKNEGEMVLSEAPAKAGAKQGADGAGMCAWMGCTWREYFDATEAVLA